MPSASSLRGRPTLNLHHRVLQTLLMRVRPAPVASLLKRLLGLRRVTVETAQGWFKVDPVSLMGIALTRSGGYEEGMTATLKTFLKPGHTFVDLGANEGYFTVIGAKLCGPSGRVLAIEPQQRLLPVIEENIRLNGVGNTKVLNVAISDQSGTATLNLTSDTNSGGSGLYRHTKYKLPTQEIATQTLEQVLIAQGLNHVDLLKVDIEGFEYEAVLGSPRVFQQQRVKALALELHPTILADRGKSAGDIERMLEQAGYRLTETFGNTVWIADDGSNSELVR